MKLHENPVHIIVVVTVFGHVQKLPAQDLPAHEIVVHGPKQVFCADGAVLVHQFFHRRQAVHRVDHAVELQRPGQIPAAAVEYGLAALQHAVVKHGHVHEAVHFPRNLILVFLKYGLGLNIVLQVFFINLEKLLECIALCDGLQLLSQVPVHDGLIAAPDRQLQNL